MIKFKNPDDENLFRFEFLDSGKTLEEFLEQKLLLEEQMVDWEKSQAQKQNWRQHRHDYMKGIRKFHRSTQGKRMHRNLGRYLATREPATLMKTYQTEKDKEKERGGSSSLGLRKVTENLEFLISVMSACTHALVEKRYYEVGLDESVQYDLFLEELLKHTQEVIDWVHDKSESIDYDFWVRIVEPSEWEKLGADTSELKEDGNMAEWLANQIRAGKVRMLEVGEDADG
jgi:hypothetical protein